MVVQHVQDFGGWCKHCQYNFFPTDEARNAGLLQPPEEQREILEGMYDRAFLYKVIKICGSRSRRFKEELEKRSDEDLAEMLKTPKHPENSDAATNKRIETNE